MNKEAKQKNTDKYWLVAIVAIAAINCIIQLSYGHTWAAVLNAVLSGGIAYMYWDSKLRKKI